MLFNPRLGGFLSRIARDARGNTLAIVAAALIPMLAMTGSAIDAARLYVVKVRLQQACDAGVLAGRKFMTDSDSTTLDATATTRANTFFANNFRAGWFQTAPVSFTPTKSSDSQVNGIASATVPMAVMQIFGVSSVPLNVSCQARYDVADADIMFVLDTTGSMACAAADSQSTCDSYVVSNTTQNSDGSWTVAEKSSSRIAALRTAVANFYDTLTSNADPTTHFRFGFVPYNATANVGYLLPSSYLVSSWTYQSRVAVGDYTKTSTLANTYTNVTSATCDTKKVARSPALGSPAVYTYTPPASSATDSTVTWTSTSGTNGTCKVYNNVYGPVWRYMPVTFPVSSFIAGNTVDDPSDFDGSTSKWAGCVEERGTTVASSFSATSPPPDLDVDTAPGSDDSTKWRPMWPDVEYARQTAGSEDSSSTLRTTNSRYQFGSNSGNGYPYAGPYNELPCPKQASRLTTMTRSQIANYVSASTGFKPYGVTYHDVGMTWGTRLISPNGMFQSDTAAWTGHNAPNRYIIFMTDGPMEPDAYAYTAHGMEQWDQRVTGGSTSNLLAYHNARFTTACQIAKNRNIEIFVISYAQAMTTQMQSCASPGQAYYASDDASLNTAFGSIASQVALLRLSR